MKPSFPIQARSGSSDEIETFVAQEESAYNYGFYYQSPKQVLEYLQDHLRKMEDLFHKQASRSAQETAMINMMDTMLSFCTFSGFHPKDIIRLGNERFQKRFANAKRLAQEAGLKDLQDLPFETLVTFWEKATAHER